MRTRIFVGGLSWDTDNDSLKRAFESIGQVDEAVVITHRDGDLAGKSKGFGFVRFSSEDEAEEAVDTMDGYQLDGRSIRVDWATEKKRENNGGNQRGGDSRGRGNGRGNGRSNRRSRD